MSTCCNGRCFVIMKKNLPRFFGGALLLQYVIEESRYEQQRSCEMQPGLIGGVAEHIVYIAHGSGSAGVYVPLGRGVGAQFVGTSYYKSRDTVVDECGSR